MKESSFYKKRCQATKKKMNEDKNKKKGDKYASVKW
jgi:hypothetical protein